MKMQTKKGNFVLIKDYRGCFDKEEFESRYIEEIHNKYRYFVGDYSSDILRIKGFFENKKPNYHNIPDYLNESCQLNCAYYILKRDKGENNE